MRRALLALVLLIGLLSQPAAPPSFTATWQSPTVAALRWQQPAGVALTCLYRNTTLLRCWADLPQGTVALTLGDRGPLDYSAHPQVGDVFVLDQDGVVSRAPLLWVVQLPMMRDTRAGRWVVMMPAIRG